MNLVRREQPPKCVCGRCAVAHHVLPKEPGDGFCLGYVPTVVGGVITPYKKTVEAIAKLVGGPADGNLVEHVRAMVDGAAQALRERDRLREELTILRSNLGTLVKK